MSLLHKELDKMFFRSLIVSYTKAIAVSHDEILVERKLIFQVFAIKPDQYKSTSLSLSRARV